MFHSVVLCVFLGLMNERLIGYVSAKNIDVSVKHVATIKHVISKRNPNQNLIFVLCQIKKG